MRMHARSCAPSRRHRRQLSAGAITRGIGLPPTDGFRLVDGRYVCTVTGCAWNVEVDTPPEPDPLSRYPENVARIIRRRRRKGKRVSEMTDAEYEEHMAEQFARSPGIQFGASIGE